MHVHATKQAFVYYCLTGVEWYVWHLGFCCSQSVLVKQVLSHVAVWLTGREAGQASQKVTQLLDGVMAVRQEVTLHVVTQLEHRGWVSNGFSILISVTKLENRQIGVDTTKSCYHQLT